MYSLLVFHVAQFLIAVNVFVSDGESTVVAPRLKTILHLFVADANAIEIRGCALFITFAALNHTVGIMPLYCICRCALHCFPASANHTRDGYENQQHPNAHWNPLFGHHLSVNYLD